MGLDAFDFVDGRIRIKPDAPTSGPAACKAMGISWDKCVLWEGLPLMTAEEVAVGFASNITFDVISGEVQAVEADNGATAKLLLGKLDVPADYILGFKRGMGADLAVRDDSRETGDAVEFKGAIVVSNDVWELSPEGGWAEAAGKWTAKAGAKASDAVAKAKPKVEAAAASATVAAGQAVSEGAQAVTKQVSATKDAFGAFKDEFSKAAAGEESDEEELEEDSKPGMFAAFKEEFTKAAAGEAEDEDDDDDFDDEEEFEEYDEDDSGVEYEDDAEDGDEYEDDEDDVVSRTAKKAASKYGGMFASFKEEFDKASKE